MIIRLQINKLPQNSTPSHKNQKIKKNNTHKTKPRATDRKYQLQNNTRKAHYTTLRIIHEKQNIKPSSAHPIPTQNSHSAYTKHTPTPHHDHHHHESHTTHNDINPNTKTIDQKKSQTKKKNRRYLNPQVNATLSQPKPITARQPQQPTLTDSSMAKYNHTQKIFQTCRKNKILPGP